MGITLQTLDKDQKKTLKIIISGKLGNVIQKEYRQAYENNPADAYIIDLGKVESIDSSGLGMMLLMRDFAGGDHADISIINCSKHILDIFNVTCFHKLFKIDQLKNNQTKPC